MPNNCSTLIQRKQNILHKILRSNSDGKLQNAVAETTAELCIAGTRKTPAYTASTAHHLTAGASTSRRSHVFNTNRIQPSSNHYYDTHLPAIRDTNGSIDRQHQASDEPPSSSRPKTPLTNASPRSAGRPPSASMSSFFNALAKQSTENFMITNGTYEDTNDRTTAPPSRRSHRLSKGNEAPQNTAKQTVVPQKPSGDSGVDIRFSSSSGDTNQQQRVLAASSRLRTNAPYAHGEPPPTLERTTPGQHYQRRTNNTIKAPLKQKIDKYRRRSEEATQATSGGALLNATSNGLSATSPNLVPSSSNRSKAPPPSPTLVRRVASDGEIQARLEVLRLSMDANNIHPDQQALSHSYQHSHNRVKSPYLYNNNHQQKISTAPPTNTHAPSLRLRRNPGSTQPISPPDSFQRSKANTRRPQQQQSVKQSTNTGAGNLYLAFIASRHLSTLEDTLFECDIDHQKLLRIFTWLKGVEKHRHEQTNHDQLLIEQDQHMLDQDEDLSLYSEVQYAVDDIPANTTGKPCEKIAPMQFED